MDVLSHLASGFGAALTPTNLLMALFGSLLGTLVGVLPGLGPTAAIAILFPLTTVLPPVPAIIMLAGIYYGAMYGGSTTAILLNIPGEVASVPTCL
ncbi:MAG: tripartite tricarboxylate transporter permease, partial [Candidatus Rokubacteria bacterium]|nr:tripartite tricarboxylate transporter permease [Candidatus Rokubacteria bacterium]